MTDLNLQKKHGQGRTCIITRRATFSSSHRYWLPELSAKENNSRFGKCALAEGHGHNYELIVSMAGKLDADGMVLNLLQWYDLEKSRELVQRSFGCYLASLDLFDDQEILHGLREQLKKLQLLSDNVPWNDFEDYEKHKGRLKEERRLLRILQKQASETLTNELTLALQFANLGTLISLKNSSLQSKVVPAFIVEKIEGKNELPLLLCLTNSNITSIFLE